VRLLADSPPHRLREQRGFSLLELVVVIILVVMLFLVAADRLLPLRGQAEATHVAVMIGTLRSSLGLVTAERIVNHGLPAVRELADSNPMDLLQQPYERYAGEFDSPATADVRPGAWYFDRSTSALSYRVRFPQYLEDSAQAPVELRWRVTVQVEQRDNPTGNTEQHITGVSLTRLDSHRWADQQVLASIQ
jgi:prepilin-type N-terminal cleavage/methylation domain-containing protein